MRIRIEILTSKLQIDVDPESVPDLAYQFYVDQDPDPDPAFYLMRIQVTIKKPNACLLHRMIPRLRGPGQI